MRMKSVIIVDDEIHVISLLKHLIHWDELNLVLKGSYTDGEEALEALKKESADIVISDIMMPGMSGIELAEVLKQDFPQCKVVFISGHRDFEFARNAVKLGVEDYILKPLNEQEINNTLKSILNKFLNTEERPNANIIMRQKLAESITVLDFSGSIDHINSKYSTNFREGGKFRVLQLAICNVSRDSKIEKIRQDIIAALSKNIQEYCYDQESIRMSELRYCIIIQIKEEMDKQVLRILDTTYRELVRKYAEVTTEKFYLSAGKIVDTPENLKESYEGSSFFLAGRFVYGTTRFYIADILPQAERVQQENYQIPTDIIRRFETMIEGIDLKGIELLINKLFDDYRKEKDINPMLYIYMVSELGEHLMLVLKRCSIHPREIKKIGEQLNNIIDNCDTVMMLRSEVKKFFTSVIEQYLSIKRNNAAAYVNQAKQFIDEYYAEKLSLNEIAEKLHVNSAYLSTIFKEETGENYSDYLTSVRIEKAKELLTELDFNISQIAAKVGYTSSRYFSRIFEEETGLKPSEYRRIYLRGLRK